MPKEVTRFKCEHCYKKLYASKYAAIRHEKRCFCNPEVKSCVTCNNRTYHEDYGDCWCKPYQKEVIKKGNPIRNCPLWELNQFDLEEYEDA
jgi:hypothetical protein